MTAHLAVPAIEPDSGVPATLSNKVLDGLLQEDLGF
jgi:beta-N-acetylhexosaminidase